MLSASHNTSKLAVFDFKVQNITHNSVMLTY